MSDLLEDIDLAYADKCYVDGCDGRCNARRAALAIADWFDDLKGSSTDVDMWAHAADRLRHEAATPPPPEPERKYGAAWRDRMGGVVVCTPAVPSNRCYVVVAHAGYPPSTMAWGDLAHPLTPLVSKETP